MTPTLRQAYTRLVTDIEVGELGRYLTRRRAERIAARFNSQPEPRPVEYEVEHRGFCRWAVIAYQTKLVPIRNGAGAAGHGKARREQR
jgi:hypothetical protein